MGNNRADDKSSKYVGVSYMSDSQSYQAYISANNKKYPLGVYKDETHAAYAYDAAVREMKLDKKLNNVVLSDEIQNAINEKVSDRIKTRDSGLTISEIHQGRKLETSNPLSAKYMGVSYDSESSLYQVAITDKRYRLGYYQTPEEAAYAYDLGAMKFYRDPKLNFHEKQSGEYICKDVPGLTDEKKNAVKEKINGIIEDNEKQLTQQQKMQGKTLERKIPMTSKYVGVYYKKDKEAFEAIITKSPIKFHLGRSQDEAMLATCYDIAAEYLYGQNGKEVKIGFDLGDNKSEYIAEKFNEFAAKHLYGPKGKEAPLEFQLNDSEIKMIAEKHKEFIAQYIYGATEGGRIFNGDPNHPEVELKLNNADKSLKTPGLVKQIRHKVDKKIADYLIKQYAESKVDSLGGKVKQADNSKSNSGISGKIKNALAKAESSKTEKPQGTKTDRDPLR